MARAEFFNNRLVDNLPEPQAALLYETGAISTLPAGALVIEEGQHIDKLYIILSGRVDVYLPESESRPASVKLNTLRTQDCFGEYGMIDGKPASASIRTASETVLFEIPYRHLERVLDAKPEIGCIVYRNLLAILVDRLRDSNRELDLFTVP